MRAAETMEVSIHNGSGWSWVISCRQRLRNSHPGQNSEVENATGLPVSRLVLLKIMAGRLPSRASFAQSESILLFNSLHLAHQFSISRPRSERRMEPTGA